MSLRWKLVLAMVLLTSLATAVFGVASYRSTRDRLMAEVDRSLADVPQAVLIRSAAAPVFVTDGFERMAVQIVGPDGDVIGTTFPETIGIAATPRRPVRRDLWFNTVGTESGDFRVLTTEMPDGTIAQVGRPLDETNRVLTALRNRTIALILLVAALAATVGWFLADVITGPLRRLTAAADDVAASGRPERGLDRITDASNADTASPGGDEVRRLSAGFGRMLRALARSQEEQERLVQDAGHELRTPLTSLRTNLDTLARYPDITADQRSAIVNDLQAEMAELSELVDEIVAVAGGGLTGDAPHEPPTSFDLTELAGSIAERYARRTGRDVNVAGDPLPVVGERTAVQRALSCLIDNARKFDPSGAAIEVEIARLDGEEAAEVRVRDHGPGIAERDLDIVFDRFHRAPEARTLPGSGLGLAIVKAVAERHGGVARAANHPDGGAVVRFTLALQPS